MENNSNKSSSSNTTNGPVTVVMTTKATIPNSPSLTSLSSASSNNDYDEDNGNDNNNEICKNKPSSCRALFYYPDQYLEDDETHPQLRLASVVGIILFTQCTYVCMYVYYIWIHDVYNDNEEVHKCALYD